MQTLVPRQLALVSLIRRSRTVLSGATERASALPQVMHSSNLVGIIKFPTNQVFMILKHLQNLITNRIKYYTFIWYNQLTSGIFETHTKKKERKRPQKKCEIAQICNYPCMQSYVNSNLSVLFTPHAITPQQVIVKTAKISIRKCEK